MKHTLKKLLCAALCACLAAGTAVPALAATLGDMDNSGTVASADARVILRAAVGLEQLPEADLKKADMNGDGAVTAADARLALRTAVGLEMQVNAVYENQYDILRSGSYTAEIYNGGMEDMQMNFSVSASNTWIFSSFPTATFAT